MRTMIQNRKTLAVLAMVFACGIVWVVSAGNLYPPAPPSSTMKTLEEVHTAVQSLHGVPQVATPIRPSSLYLQVTGIEGESQSMGHENWIDALGYMVNVANGAASAKGDPNPLFSGVYIIKYQDKASVPLMLKCCNNRPVELVTLEIAVASHNEVVYYRLRLWDARVAFVEPFSAANSGAEVIAFTDYTKIEWSYRPSTPTGEPLPWIIEEWDIERNGGNS